ncbi:MAG: IS630 family transposase [Dehalococcoidia bacterium]|nr:IS630 family transposase [Dehalococcoidia bacterium]
MTRIATLIALTDEERTELESWVRKGTMEQRLVRRARIVLESAAGKMNKEIAQMLGIRADTVSQWRNRFSHNRLDGLQDAPRPGKTAKYNTETEKRILNKLDTQPPEGYTTWTGRLLAQSLGDVSNHHIWRVLKWHGIHLQRRHSWCVSTDPEFTQKAADIVGLYLNPPENAVVISVDEKPAIQALERAQGWLCLPNGQAVRGFNHEYKRHGTTTLFAALEVATGLVRIGHYVRRRRREFLDFMNQIVAQYPDTELHVILDNLNTHKPKHDRWLTKHPNIHFHYTPTHASWLNQVECWFSILWRQALRGLSTTSSRNLRKAIDSFTEAYSQNAHPFEWTKHVVHPGQLKHKYGDLCN